MESLVLQLQSNCLDTSIAVSDILRKALVVARKLSLSDAEAWIEKELNGYKTGDKAPRHRMLKGSIQCWNPPQGWVPVIFSNDTEAAEALSEWYCGQPIGVLEEVVKGEGEILQVPFDPETERQIMHGLPFKLQPKLHVPKAAVNGVIHVVRNLVLDWSLKLEKDGILGEGMVFNTKEKETASHSSYTINYHGPVGNSQIQQGSAHSTQSMSVAGLDVKALTEFMASLNTYIADLKLGMTETRQVQADVSTVETQLSSPRPNHVILRESLRSIRNILEGCAGSLLASGLVFEINKLLP
jgi:AbiTii